MAIFRKSSAKSGGAKKSTSASKKSATPKKAPPTKKAAASKTAAKPKAKPAPPTKAVAKEKTTSAPTTPSRAKLPAKPERPKRPGRAVVVKAGTAVATKLGTKWSCFKCGAKFYDLNKPEPLCPKCGADQRTRPKVAPSPSPTPAPKKQPRPMAPLLEDEDDGSVRYEEDIDLGVRTEADEPDEELFQPGEFEEDDVFSGPEEE